MRYNKGDLVMLLKTPDDYYADDKESFGRGRIGRIVTLYRIDDYVGVEWQIRLKEGHTSCGDGQLYHCWNVDTSIIKKII